MTSPFRTRFTALATAAFALSWVLGNAITPALLVDPAARLDAMEEHAVLLTSIYVARMVSFVLITPTLVGALRLLRARGTGLGHSGAGLLLTGHVVGAGAVTLIGLQFFVLAPAADRAAAVAAVG